MHMRAADRNSLTGHADFAIRELRVEDAASVSGLLRAQPPEYAHFFYAFGPGEEELARILSARRRDIYSGIFWRGELAAVFMLRGWDAGYEVPSFGVLVDVKHRGRAFMRISLDVAKLICRLSGATRLMAKIHPDNVSPRGARRLGFVQTGVEPETGNVVYHMEL